MARPPSDIRARLVDAARTRFLNEGVDGASLRDIAKDAETSLGMIVYYFPKKEDLFLAVVESVYQPLLDDLVARIEGAPDTRTRLHAVAMRVATASARELDVLRLIAREAIGSTARRRRILRRFMRGHVPHLVRVLAEGVERRELDGSVPVPLMLVSFVGLVILPQVVRRASTALPLPERDALVETSLDMFFRAAGAPAVAMPIAMV